MARVTYVKAARQRFEMVPVLNDDGTEKRTEVQSKHGGQKTTKKGRPVTMRVTVPDRTRPLPNLTCGKCSAEIKPGDPYKHISPRSGPYGGRTLYRCATCPTWQVWEYSSSLSARLAEVAHNAEEALGADFDSPDEVQTVLDDAAEAVRGIASEKAESAQNIEDGFQHATSQSEELADQAEQLESWADEISGTDIPDLPEPDEDDCGECGGTGLQEPVADGDGGETQEPCEECDGSGRVTPDAPTDDQMEEWRDEARTAAMDVINESPV